MHTLRLWSLPSIKEWRVYCLRYPLVEWVIYGMWAFVGFTALQSLWGGIALRLGERPLLVRCRHSRPLV